jgi:hypothetical protein
LPDERLAQIVGKIQKAPGLEEARDGREPRAALLEEGVNRGPREGVASRDVEREGCGLLERIEIETVGELARRRLEVTLGELGLVELELHLRHREERRPASIGVAEQARQKAASLDERIPVAESRRRRGPHLERLLLLDLAKHRKGGLVLVIDDIAEIGNISRCTGELRSPFESTHGLDDVLGSERRGHDAGLVDDDVRHVQVAGRRGKHHGHGPSHAGNAAHAPNVAHIEQPAEVLAQPVRDGLPNGLASHG